MGLFYITKKVSHIANLKTIIAVIVITASLFTLSACEKPSRPNATTDDFVGVWACYGHQEGKDFTEYKLGEGINHYLIIYKNGKSYEVMTTNGENPIAKESRWHRTRENKETGEDSGILLVGNQYENPYVYYNAGEEPKFIDEHLVKGNLAIEYADNTYYYEKVSNDPDDPKWLPSTISVINAKEIESPSMPEGAVDWSNAKSHIGEIVTVFGSVKDSSYLTESNGQPSYIDIGAAYPDKTRVSMVVWGEDRDNFSGEPENIYLNKTICVTGKLYSHDNVTYVKVESPDQIQVLD